MFFPVGVRVSGCCAWVRLAWGKTISDGFGIVSTCEEIICFDIRSDWVKQGFGTAAAERVGSAHLELGWMSGVTHVTADTLIKERQHVSSFSALKQHYPTHTPQCTERSTLPTIYHNKIDVNTNALFE